MISITFDTDWAPTPLIEDSIALLDEHGIPATFFSTHDDGLDLGEHERALHPNFFADYDEPDILERQHEIFKDLLDVFPDASSVRSHSLHTSQPLRRMFSRYGIKYESNFQMLGVDGLRPCWVGDWTIDFPIYFHDNLWMKCHLDDPAVDHGETLNPRPDVEAMLSSPGLKVFLFHPHHVFLNNPDLNYQAERSELYHPKRVDELSDERYEGYGVRSIFLDLLETIEEGSYEPKTIRELGEEFVENDHEYPPGGYVYSEDAEWTSPLSGLSAPPDE